VCVGMSEAALKFALSLYRTLTLGGKLFNIFVPLQIELFKQDRLEFGLRRRCSFLVLKLCIDEIQKFSDY